MLHTLFQMLTPYHHVRGGKILSRKFSWDGNLPPAIIKEFSHTFKTKCLNFTFCNYFTVGKIQRK